MAPILLSERLELIYSNLLVVHLIYIIERATKAVLKITRLQRAPLRYKSGSQQLAGLSSSLWF